MRRFVTDTFFAVASCGITAALVAGSAPAAAATIDADAPRQAVVATADLNLAVPAGRTAAERRIRAAANQVCATGNPSFTVDAGCRDKAIADATRALGGTTFAAR